MTMKSDPIDNSDIGHLGVPIGFVFPAKRVLLWLMAIICVLTITSLYTFHLAQMGEGEGYLWDIRKNFMRLFNVDKEANIPTWYSSVALLGAAALLIYIVALKSPHDRYLWHWKVLAAAFVYLSIDEFSQLHEMLNKPIRATFNTDGFLYYPWVVVAALCLIVFVGVYAKFLWHLPQRTRWLFILGGSVFVSGAIGFESLSSYFETQYGVKSVSYELAMTVEEFGEMTGVAIFIFALMEYTNDLLASPAK